LFEPPTLTPIVADEGGALCNFPYYLTYLVAATIFARFVQEELKLAQALSSATTQIIGLSNRKGNLATTQSLS
jgi:hypothetical protein